jgi:hypothetical protein
VGWGCGAFASSERVLFTSHRDGGIEVYVMRALVGRQHPPTMTSDLRSPIS